MPSSLAPRTFRKAALAAILVAGAGLLSLAAVEGGSGSPTPGGGAAVARPALSPTSAPPTSTAPTSTGGTVSTAPTTQPATAGAAPVPVPPATGTASAQGIRAGIDPLAPIEAGTGAVFTVTFTNSGTTEFAELAPVVRLTDATGAVVGRLWRHDQGTGEPRRVAMPSGGGHLTGATDGVRLASGATAGITFEFDLPRELRPQDITVSLYAISLPTHTEAGTATAKFAVVAPH